MQKTWLSKSRYLQRSHSYRFYEESTNKLSLGLLIIFYSNSFHQAMAPIRKNFISLLPLLLLLFHIFPVKMRTKSFYTLLDSADSLLLRSLAGDETTNVRVSWFLDFSFEQSLRVWREPYVWFSWEFEESPMCRFPGSLKRRYFRLSPFLDYLYQVLSF